MRGKLVARAVLVACVLVGGAAHADDAKARHKEAARLVADGDYAGALRVIDEALVAAPDNLALLQLRATTMVEMRDYEGALAAYEAFLAAGAKGANRRAAKRIIANLEAARTTRLDLTITGATADDPATVFVDSRSLGVFCVAAPRCEHGMLPGDYKLIVERPGHKKLSERITTVQGQTLTLERAMIEEPSALTVAVTGTSAEVTVSLDGEALGAPPQARSVEPGAHVIELRAPGYVTERIEVAAARGQPVDVAVALRALVPVAVTPPDAEVLIGDAPAPRQDGALALPSGAVTLTVRAAGHVAQVVEVPASRADGYRLEVALARSPAPLTVAGAPAGAVVEIDGQVVGRSPLAAPVVVEQGAHTVEIRAAGRASFRAPLDVGSDAPLTLTVEAMPTTRRTWTWITAAGAGAALISWGVFGSLALDRERDFAARAAEPGSTPADEMLVTLAEQGDRYATLSDVSLVVALAGAGAATWLWMHEGKAPARGRITPLVGAGAVGVSGAF